MALKYDKLKFSLVCCCCCIVFQTKGPSLFPRILNEKSAFSLPTVVFESKNNAN